MKKMEEEIKESYFEELERLRNFSKEVKRLARSSGRSYRISTADLEELFVKFGIKL